MRKLLPPLLIVAATIASALFYSDLPARMPTHWNLSGEADGWSSRLWGAWLLPLVMAVIWVILRLVPHIDPKRANYAKFQGVYDWLVVTILAFMFFLHILVLGAATGWNVRVGQLIPAGVGVMFIAMGLLLPGAHQNWFIGIRTPWTLTSELSWQRTHRAGGLLFTLVGAATILAAVAIPRLAVPVLMTTGLASGIFLLAYSYVVWKEDKEGASAA